MAMKLYSTFSKFPGNEKRETGHDEGFELPNQDKIRKLTMGREETCKYLGILEENTIKQVEMKD